MPPTLFLLDCRNTECSKGCKWYTGGNVLAMQLGRTVGLQKLQHHVTFPEELDLSPWMHPGSPELAEGASLMYDLTTVIVHAGKDPTAGHYVAVCRLGAAEGLHPLCLHLQACCCMSWCISAAAKCDVRRRCSAAAFRSSPG